MHITQDLAPVRYPVRMCGFERARWWVSATAVAAALAGCTAGDDQVDAGPPEPEPTFDYPLDDVLRLNHLQAKSTHNSYHIEGEESGIPDWAYTHAPLDVQLGEQGVRHFELDLYRSESGETRHAAGDSFLALTLVEGEGMTKGGEEFPLRSGDTVLVPAGREFAIEPQGEGACTYLIASVPVE